MKNESVIHYADIVEERSPVRTNAVGGNTRTDENGCLNL